MTTNTDPTAASGAASPLTDDQIKAIHHGLCTTTGANYLSMARAVEAAHGITEAAPAAQEAEHAMATPCGACGQDYGVHEGNRCPIGVPSFFRPATPRRPQADAGAVPQDAGRDDEVLPLLVRDIANDLGRPALEVIGALRVLGLGNYSVNTAVTKAMASRLRQHFEPQAPAAPAAAAADALEVVLDAFERKERGRLAATLAASLVEEVRAAMATPAPAAGAAPTDAEEQLLSPAEQKWLLADPTAIRSLMTAIDVNHSDYSSAVEPGEIEPWPPKRWTELRELGRAIIAVDPECFDEQTLRDFGFPVPPRAAAPAELLKFYNVGTAAELIAAQARHVERLQAKRPQAPSFAPQRVREG